MSEAIDAYLEKNLEKYVQEIIRLCAQPSISATSEGASECAVLVADILKEHGYDVRAFETAGNPVIVGHLDGESDRTLLFYNHYDVQPVDPLDLWETPPFEPDIREGRIYARGAKDDKGELVARLAAVDAAREANGGALPCGVTFCIEGNEEMGSPHIAPFVQEHTDILASQAAIWEEGGLDPADGAPLTIIGARGILYVELRVRTLNMDAHSGSAHILPSAAWRLLRALASLKDEHERILIPGFYDKAKPASQADLAVIEKMLSSEDWRREVFGVREFVNNMSGQDLERAVFKPTCNIAGITTGYQGEGGKTVLPATASCKIDFRLVPDQDPEDIFEKLRRHLDQQGYDDIELERLGQMWPHKTEPDDPFVKLGDRACLEVYGVEPRVMPMTGGSSPLYAFSRPLGGIPITGIGVGAAGNNQAHSPNEWVGIEDLHNTARYIARIVGSFADLSDA